MHKLQNGKGASRPASKRNQPRKQKPCYRYNGTDHTPDKCKFRDGICHACSKKGHIQRAYLQKKHSDLKKKLNFVDKYDDSDDEYVISTLSECNCVDSKKPKSDMIWILARINGKLLQMELDTG